MIINSSLLPVHICCISVDRLKLPKRYGYKQQMSHLYIYGENDTLS